MPTKAASTHRIKVDLVDNHDGISFFGDSVLSFGTGGGGPFAFGQDGAIPATGDYTLVVGAFNAVFTDDITGITTLSSGTGAYNLNITTGGVSPVPLPTGGVLLISGLMGLAAARRKKKSA